MAVIGWIPKRTHCRCRRCGTRQVKAMRPEEYLRPPRCRGCGERGTLRVDKWANARPWRKETCRCDGYWFPHRRGKGWCRHNKELEGWIHEKMDKDPGDFRGLRSRYHDGDEGD